MLVDEGQHVVAPRVTQGVDVDHAADQSRGVGRRDVPDPLRGRDRGAGGRDGFAGGVVPPGQLRCLGSAGRQGLQPGRYRPLGAGRGLGAVQGALGEILGLRQRGGVVGARTGGRARVAGVGTERGRGRRVAGARGFELGRRLDAALPEHRTGAGIPELVGAHRAQPPHRRGDLVGGRLEPAAERRYLHRVTGNRVGVRQRRPVRRPGHQMASSRAPNACAILANSRKSSSSCLR